jgi:hypothetical protein
MTLIISLGSIYDRELRKFSSASQIEYESVAPVLANEKYANQFYFKKVIIHAKAFGRMPAHGMVGTAIKFSTQKSAI